MALLLLSPLGVLSIHADEQGLRRIQLVNAPPSSELADAYEHEVAKQLTEYFSGSRQKFNLTMAPFIGTPMQIQVWKKLCTLPYGTTSSYKELALQVGYNGAWRAVGAACARNPTPIVGACHRVVASSGALTGFAWGLVAKKQLLTLEERNSDGTI